MIDDNQQARNWAMGCHLAALTFFLGVPFGNIFGPLLIWLLKRNEFELVNEQGKESLNFQISIIIYSLVVTVLVVIFTFTLVLIPVAILLGIGLVLLLGLDLVLVIVASVKVSNGDSFRYPLTMQFLK
jgi:uncharacterized Tic20 family protein